MAGMARRADEVAPQDLRHADSSLCLKVQPIAPGLCDRRLRFQEGTDMAYEQFVILKQSAVAGIGIEDQLGVA